MVVRTPRRASALAAGLLLACSALASEAPARQAFDAGVQSFQAGELADALTHFETSEAMGLDTPQLHYNLGVARYRLGRLVEAETAFLRLTLEPGWRSLAWYNLGLTAEARGESALARERYRMAADLAEDDRLLGLARAKLRSLEPRAAPVAFVRQWFGYGAVAAGYDDNVALTDDRTDLAASGEDDYFAEVLGVARRQVSGTRDRGWGVELGGYLRQYQDLDDFSFASLTAGMFHHRLAGHWLLQAGGRAELLRAGGDAFTNNVLVRMSGYRVLTGGLGVGLRQDARYVDGAGGYDYLTGWQARTTAELVWRGGAATWRGGAQFEINDRDDLRRGAEFYSHSPQRWLGFTEWEVRPAERLAARIRAELRRSDFADPNVEIESDGSTGRRTRSEDRVDLRARLAWGPEVSWRVFGEYQFTRNDANIRRFEYDNQRVLVGLERSF
jgi:hypothetical protein